MFKVVIEQVGQFKLVYVCYVLQWDKSSLSTNISNVTWASPNDFRLVGQNKHLQSMWKEKERNGGEKKRDRVRKRTEKKKAQALSKKWTHGRDERQKIDSQQDRKQVKPRPHWRIIRLQRKFVQSANLTGNPWPRLATII